METELIYLGMAGIVAIGGIVIAKMWQNGSNFEARNFKKRFKLQEDYIKELEDDNDSIKKELRSVKNRQNAKENVQMDLNPESGLEELIPAFVGDISQFLPKKLQPFFQDKELQGAVIKKVMDNPEKFKPIIDRVIKKSVGAKPNANNQTQENELSV